MEKATANKTIKFQIRPPYHVNIRVIDGGWLWLHNWNFPPGDAPFWRFYWNKDPGCHMLFKGERFDLTPNRCFLIPPYTPFEARQTNLVWHFCLHFVTTTSGLKLAPGIYEAPLSETLLFQVENLIKRLTSESDHSLQTILLWQLLAQQALFEIPGNQLIVEQRDECITRALQYMENHLSEPLPTSDLAEKAGMPINPFIRLFKKIMGETPQQHCHALRMEHAAILLLSTNLSIKEIADETGFCDRYHVSHGFAKKHGLGPAQFRSKHTNHKVFSKPSADGASQD